jgi:methionyl-tRNA formyltransferase
LQISVASSSLISLPIIEAILGSEHTLASVITHPDRKVGRGQNVSPNALAEWAESKGIRVAKPADISEINKHLLDVQPQLVITASYGKLIPPELLHGPRFGWLNLHFSLLPKWRGAAPVQWAILEGDEVSGITIFKLDKGMDTGPIYIQEEIHIGDEASTEELLDLMAQRGGNRILDAVAMITSAQRPKPQSQSGISLAPKISKEMGAIDWSKPAVAILRQLRALAERPGTYSFFREMKVNIHSAKLSPITDHAHKPGDIWSDGSLLYVMSADMVLELGDITPAGKKRMSAGDFMRGARIEPGDRFSQVG